MPVRNNRGFVKIIFDSIVASPKNDKQKKLCDAVIKNIKELVEIKKCRS